MIRSENKAKTGGIRATGDGEWSAAVVVGYDSGGFAVWGEMRANSAEELREKLRRSVNTEAVQEAIGEERGGGKFSDMAMEYLESLRGKVKETTRARYTERVKSVILPILGTREVRTITDGDMERFSASLLTEGRKYGEGGLKEKTVADVLGLVKRIFDYAVERGKITKPPKIVKPKIVHSDVKTLSDEEYTAAERQALVRACKGKGSGAGLLIALHTGMRAGEVCGLKWSDIDFVAGTVTVRRTVERIKDVNSDGKTLLYIGKPKSEKGTRIIPLSQGVLNVLQKCRGDGDVYITSGKDIPQEPCSLYKIWRRYGKVTGRSTKVHVIRHTFATRACENGADIKALSEILGHTSVQTTLDLYTHPSMETKRRIVEEAGRHSEPVEESKRCFDYTDATAIRSCQYGIKGYSRVNADDLNECNVPHQFCLSAKLQHDEGALNMTVKIETDPKKSVPKIKKCNKSTALLPFRQNAQGKRGSFRSLRSVRMTREVLRLRATRSAQDDEGVLRLRATRSAIRTYRYGSWVYRCEKRTYR